MRLNLPRPRLWLVAGLVLLAAQPGLGAESLFNGRNLDGWQGDTNIWRVEGGVITAGSLATALPRNEFLTSTGTYANFELRLRIRLVGTNGFVNSGVQCRSVRVPGSSEMSGYQADAGAGYWGTLYDESRRGTLVPKPLDPAALQAALRPGDWNTYRIRAEGPRIRLWLNDTLTVDFTETAPGIPQDGLLGLQIHGNGHTLVQFKEISLEPLPPTPGAPTWAGQGGYRPWVKKP